MEIIKRNTIIKNLIDHPYENVQLYGQVNQDYIAKVNFIYFTEDKKACICYWEAPEGSFDFSLKDFNELDYIIDGRLEIISNGETFNLEKGDCVLFKNGDNVKFNIKKLIKAVVFIYPTTEELIDLFNSFMTDKTI